MSKIEAKLIDAYAVLVMSSKYILRETDRINTDQQLVPVKYLDFIEIRIAERILLGMGIAPPEELPEAGNPSYNNINERISNLESVIDVLISTTTGGQ